MVFVLWSSLNHHQLNIGVEIKKNNWITPAYLKGSGDEVDTIKFASTSPRIFNKHLGWDEYKINMWLQIIIVWKAYSQQISKHTHTHTPNIKVAVAPTVRDEREDT